MKPRSIGLVAALCMFTVGVAIVLLIGSPSPRPDDSLLIENFRTHESEFQKLVGMADQDSRVVMICTSFICLSKTGTNASYIYLYQNKDWPASEAQLGFSQRRWREYLNLFDNLNLKGGLYRNSALPNAVFFAVSVDTSELNNDEVAIVKKGYVYAPNGINENLTGSLDDIQINRPAIFYRKIQDHWYLFYEWSVSKPE